MIRYCKLVVLFQFLLVSVSAANDKESQLPEQIQQLDQQISQLESQRFKLLEEARQLRLTATDKDRDWKNVMGQIDRIKSQQKSLEQHREQVKKTIADKQAAETTLKQAEAAFEAAKKKLEEAKKSFDKASKDSQAAVEKQTELEKLVNETRPQLPNWETKAHAAEAESKSLHQQISSLEQQATDLAGAQHQHRVEIENLLKATGRWVSFSDDIAPIFQDRCVPCHNARNAQGRYNMATYAATFTAGQTGNSIVPGDAESSDLYNFVVDGWMPYESDPLETTQVELIRRWIELGARLDTSADANAPLLRLMPPVPQPTPPKTYAAPLPVTALAVDRSGTLLASSGYHEILIWSLEDLSLIKRISNVAQRIYGLDFHPNTNLLAVASGTPGKIGEVKLFDVQNGELVADLAVSEDSVFDVSFSPDGSHLAAAAADASVTIFEISPSNAEQSQSLRIEDHADWVNSIAWSPDGGKVVTSSRDKTCKVFDANTGELLVTFSGHQTTVNSAVYTADGKQVVSGGDDQRIRIWTVSDAKQQREISGFGGEVSQIRLLPNDHCIAIDSSGKVRHLSLNDGKELKRLDLPGEWLSALSRLSPDRTVFIGNHNGLIQAVKTVDWTLGQHWKAVPALPRTGGKD